ncbi:fungal-specific transcription factor domain-containing protein [Lipomyces chichibuensis]|uniref:fungal-specific transcription factor domain-containing protein n=1 Tax=Lipomyces chichibuensis TaxID=1546026 RepID=UPI00334420D2
MSESRRTAGIPSPLSATSAGPSTEPRLNASDRMPRSLLLPTSSSSKKFEPSNSFGFASNIDPNRAVLSDMNGDVHAAMATPATIAMCGRASVHSSVSTESGGSDGDRNSVAYAPLTPDTPPFPSEDKESTLPKIEPDEKSNKKSTGDKKKDSKEDVVRRRTRTGCLTCRKRRIKCDEGKPKCSNCTKSRRVCEGYGPRVDLRSPYFKVRSIVPLQNDHNNYAALMANGINPYAPYISPQFPSFGAPMHPDHLYAASNYYAAAATAAAAGAPYPDPAMYPPMPYMPMGYLPGPWATPGGPIIMQPVATMTADPMTSQVLPTPDSGMPLPAQSYPYWINFVPLPQHSQSAMPESLQSRVSLGEDVEFYSAGPDLTVPEHIVADLFAPPSSQTHTVSILSQSAMQGLSINPNETLTTYRPGPMKSPLMHADAQRMFRHFVHVLAHQISLFERHAPRPELITVRRMKHSSTNLWTYDIPMMALTCPSLLHAILALSALHISGMSGVSSAAGASHQHASLLHYHLAIRRLARALHDRRTNLYGATDLPVFAASLVLAFYETTIGEHDNWARHLHGASDLIQSFDKRSFIEDLDIVVEDDLAASEHKSTQADRAAQSQRRAEAVLRLDLLYFYLRMEIMHSLVSDTAPFLQTSFWDMVPCRGTQNSSLWKWDSFLKRGVLVADFIVRESGRKRGFTSALGVDASQSQWNLLFASMEAGESEFLEHTKAVEAGSCVSPFGPVIRYVGVQDAVVRMYYLMLRILLLRNHPHWTSKPAYKGGLANIMDVADKAGPLCALIGRLIGGITQATAPGPGASSAVWVSLTMPLLYAGAQLRDERQQQWAQSVLEQACDRTGWRTAFMIKAGLARIWHGHERVTGV